MAVVDSTRVIVALALGASGCADRVAEPSDAAQTSGAESSTGRDDAASTSEADATTTGTTNAADSTTGGALACAEAEDAEDYVASLMLWEQARDDAANTYWFIGERRTPTGGGFGSLYSCLYQTLIVVEDGQVVERTMYDGQPFNDEDECEPGWTEIGSDVGTHDALNEDAPVPPWNLDEVYESCCEDVLTMEGRYDRTSFYPLDHGLLHRCFWSSSSKATHAPPGWGDEIRIGEIGFGAPAQ